MKDITKVKRWTCCEGAERIFWRSLIVFAKPTTTNNARKTDGLTLPTLNKARAGSFKNKFPRYSSGVSLASLSTRRQSRNSKQVTLSIQSAVFHFQRLLLMAFRSVCCPWRLYFPPPITYISTVVRRFWYREICRVPYVFPLPYHSSDFRRVFFLPYFLAKFDLEDSY